MESTLRRPEPNEHAEYFGLYISHVPEGDIREFLKTQISEFRSVLDAIAEGDACILHEPYTWTIKQVVGHLIDVERVFGYRALRFGCGDLRPIHGMEQNEWVDHTDYETPTLRQLNEELELSRRANIMFFDRLKPEAWDNRAEADGNIMSVRALAYCIVGHVTYHLKIIESRLAS